MSDGEHIGYHGTMPAGPVYGAIRYGNTDQVEAPFEGYCWHFHSYMGVRAGLRGGRAGLRGAAGSKRRVACSTA